MLSNMVIETQRISYRGNEFAVAGIGLDTIAELMVSGERGQLETAVAQLEKLYNATQAKDDNAMTAGLTQLVLQLPGLAAKLIALAAGEPNQTDKVRKLPISVQLDAILAIGRLTFDGEDSIKNFVNGLMTLLSGMTKTARLAGQTVSVGTKA